MVNEQNVFRFDLNESLYFEKDQEVAEIMGISLEPEISIQEFNDYISIRGVIELQGSYQKAESIGDEDESYLDGYDSKRYIERVTETQYGAAEFLHRFPVEITVPSYRVENLDEVTVMISEFDYELPESDHLYLRSTIEIHGINSQVDEVNEEEAVSEPEAVEETILSARGEDESFEFEVKQEDESPNYIEDSPEQLPTLEEVTLEEAESDRWKFLQKTQSFDEFFQKNQEPAVVDEESIDESSSLIDDESASYDESYESRAEKADLTYLADMFRGGDEQYAKLRLCIVQEKDTLEALAEKYETTTIHIRNQNGLEEDDIAEGQLLYIPVKN
ncbi:stage VI sporulation protein D [Ornithinibacillus californiensis]|uniref:stage VI sporulation protein D n=1 Tax=Ornithinibacillus californiensis TaxID=161536 RepID=UPI00064E128C|nr:stage VI sporulation protein D [Ornithinibacillus californiensis]